MPDQRYWAVIPAAGSGSRLSSDRPKQYLTICGQTILEHTLSRFCRHSRISRVVAVIAPDDPFWPQLVIARHNKIRRADGGAERMHSVLNGLRLLEAEAGSEDWVLVHDAARPCIRTTDISLLIEQLRDSPAGGLLGWPVRDTMKRVNPDDAVTETIDRTGLWHALTPQMFRLQALRQAIEQALENGLVVTDEAQAMELAGHQPRFIKGAPDNIKVTLDTDLAMAKLFLQAQETEAECV